MIFFILRPPLGSRGASRRRLKGRRVIRRAPRELVHAFRVEAIAKILHRYGRDSARLFTPSGAVRQSPAPSSIIHDFAADAGPTRGEHAQDLKSGRFPRAFRRSARFRFMATLVNQTMNDRVASETLVKFEAHPSPERPQAFSKSRHLLGCLTHGTPACSRGAVLGRPTQARSDRRKRGPWGRDALALQSRRATTFGQGLDRSRRAGGTC